ncbi:hypothetical protein Vau01_069720 [Virgisporangium aurantiacum]|uniref:Uncharacterized protein n=1 Tax=Virgisporangium aurantiacum TaxID=175570 RepID=A0A8J4E2X6_9ACTN|nr:hypothetical protein Vau01_069720 [Virgisporangium aurantiacum]
MHTDPYPLRAARRVAAPRRRRTDEPRVSRRRARFASAGFAPAGFAPAGFVPAGFAPAGFAPADGHRVEIRVGRPRPGFRHPATAADLARVLEFFGPPARYGLRRISLRQRAAGAGPGIRVAGYVPPGVVVLFEQPDPPWLLAGRLPAAAGERLERAGARVRATASHVLVEWTDRALRDFVLFDGLMHEIGHHVLDHGDRRMRTADHERRADAYAAACRAALSPLWTVA